MRIIPESDMNHVRLYFTEVRVNINNKVPPRNFVLTDPNNKLIVEDSKHASKGLFRTVSDESHNQYLVVKEKFNQYLPRPYDTGILSPGTKFTISTGNDAARDSLFTIKNIYVVHPLIYLRCAAVFSRALDLYSQRVNAAKENLEPSAILNTPALVEVYNEEHAAFMRGLLDSQRGSEYSKPAPPRVSHPLVDMIYARVVEAYNNGRKWHEEILKIPEPTRLEALLRQEFDRA